MKCELEPLRDFSDEQELEKRLEQLKSGYDSAADDSYIAWALDEVMRKHGYDVKRSVVLSPVDKAGGQGSNSTRRELYIKQGSDTGIHVFQGPDGSVMMETAGLGNGLESIGDGTRIKREQASTESDRQRLYEEQVSFCSTHKELLEDLAKLGITIDPSTARDAPPSEDTSVFMVPEESESQTEGDLSQRYARRRRQGAEREMK